MFFFSLFYADRRKFSVIRLCDTTFTYRRLSIFQTLMSQSTLLFKGIQFGHFLLLFSFQFLLSQTTDISNKFSAFLGPESLH